MQESPKIIFQVKKLHYEIPAFAGMTDFIRCKNETSDTIQLSVTASGDDYHESVIMDSVNRYPLSVPSNIRSPSTKGVV